MTITLIGWCVIIVLQGVDFVATARQNGAQARRSKNLEFRVVAQVAVIHQLEQRLEAHARFMRNAVKDASYVGADYDKRLVKLERVGHSHAEMNLEKPTYHVYIDAKDIPPKPE